MIRTRATAVQVLAALVVSAASAPALAQGTTVTADPSVVYEGLIFTYDIRVGPESVGVNRLDFTLAPYLALEAVRASFDTVGETDIYDLATCAASPPYDCPGILVPAPAPTFSSYQTELAVVGGRQVVRIMRSPPAARWDHLFHIRARVLPGPYTCDPATPSSQSTAVVSGFTTATARAGCGVPLAPGEVETDGPAAWVTHRAAPPEQVGWQWQVNGAELTAPVVVGCNPAAACTPGDPDELLVAVPPATCGASAHLCFEVRNGPPDPPATGQQVTVTASLGGTVYGSVPVTVEALPVASFEIAETGGQTEIEVTETATFALVEALNADGGFERARRLRWSAQVVGRTDVTAAGWITAVDDRSARFAIPDPSVLRGAPVDVRVTASMGPPGTLVISNAVDLRVNARAGCILLADQKDVVVEGDVFPSVGLRVLGGAAAAPVVVEEWTGNGRAEVITPDPTDPSRARLTPTRTGVWTVVARFPSSEACENTEAQTKVRFSTSAPRCVLEGPPGPLGFGAVAPVRAVDQNGVPVAVEVWGSSGGSIIADGTGVGRATFTAPFAAGTVDLGARFGPDGGCSNAEAHATVEVEGSMRLTLRADRGRVRPGETLGLISTVQSSLGAGATGLRFVIEHSPELAPLRSTPTGPEGQGAGDIRPVEPATQPLSAEPSRLRGRVEYLADVPASGIGETRLATLVRPASGCGVASARLSVYAPGSSQLLAVSNTVRLDIECDPELFEATLFGKVFDDRDGDGVQGEGERGLGGVMVATAASVYAVTDAHGRYSIPRLAPGRLAVKINEATLPIGTHVRGEPTRLVTLTPGSFVRVSYAVLPPALSTSKPLALILRGSGVRVTSDGLVYHARLDPAGLGDVVEVAAHRGGEVRTLQRDRDPTSTEAWLDLPVDPIRPHWLLIQRAPDGTTSLYSLGVHVYDMGSSKLVVPWGPRLLGRLLLPGQRKAPRGRPLVLSGVWFAGGAVGVELVPQIGISTGPAACSLETDAPNPEGEALLCELPWSEATTAVAVVADPPADEVGVDPPRLRAEVPVQVSGGEHFLVGLGGAEAGCALDVPGFDAGRDCTGDGGGAFFYRGDFGAFTLTAGADLRARDPRGGIDHWDDAGSALAYVFGHDPTRVFRQLDPESYYPTYGDDGAVVDERESGGRFFLRLQAGDDYLRWGGMRTDIGAGRDPVEVGRYVRSLYGWSGRLSLGDRDDPDAPFAVRAVAFGAQPESKAARDELSVTGSSLYFLSHRDLVEGSVRATLEVLDEISGLPVRRVELMEGSDFQVDVVGGRLTLEPTLPANFFGRSLTRAQSGGPTSRLIVEYEYVPTLAQLGDVSVGARVVGELGPVHLGASYVTELADRLDAVEQDYQLVGASARLELGSWVQVELDFATSRGLSHSMARSVDGGLSITAPSETVADDDGASAMNEGNAVALNASTQLGSFTANGYARYYQRGFTDSRRAPGTRLLQGGLQLGTRLETDTVLAAQVDFQRSRVRDGPGIVRTLTLLRGQQSLGDFELAAEAEYAYWRVARDGEDQHRLQLGAQVGYHLTDEILLLLRRRQPLVNAAGPLPPGDTAVGALYRDAERWSLGGEVGLDDEATPFARVHAGMPVDESTELYLAFQRSSRLGEELDPLGERPTNQLVAGGRRTRPSGTSLWAENAYHVHEVHEGEAGVERVTTRTVGAEVPLGGALRLSFHYQRGAVETELGGAAGEVVRDAGSIGAEWASEKVNVRGGIDARIDGEDQWQIGATGRGEVRATDWLTVALALRGGSAFGVGGDLGAPLRAAWEGSTGFAVRPVEHDWINAFGRYALLNERAPSGSVDATEQWSHIAALALMFEILRPLAIGTKVAYRYTDVTLVGSTGPDVPDASDAGGGVDDDAMVGALRADVHLDDTWDATVEGRLCGSPTGGGDITGGALVELGVRLLGFMQMGLGYNFSDISTSGVRCEEPGARGLFVRAEVLY